VPTPTPGFEHNLTWSCDTHDWFKTPYVANTIYSFWAQGRVENQFRMSLYDDSMTLLASTAGPKR